MTEEIETPDFGHDAALPAAAEVFAKLDSLVELQVSTEKEIEDLESRLKEKKAQLEQLEENQIPELMASMRMSDYRTSRGRRVEIKRDVRTSIPNAEKDITKHTTAMQWLIANGQSGVIKNVISVKLGRGDDARAKEIEAELKERGFHPDVRQWVEPQTLKKLVTEMLTDGKAIPFEPFNIFDQKIAKITT